MLEIPETAVLANQINQTIARKQIANVLAQQSPHKFAWFSGNPQNYHNLLTGKTIIGAVAYAGQLEIEAGDMTLVFCDGVNLRFYPAGAEKPAKHQLLITFNDESALCATIAMYGGLWCLPKGTNDNPYYLAARDKPSPLTDAFDREYFEQLVVNSSGKLSLKAFLATDQRIPGLGNGVLQDILYNAALHPKKKLGSLNQEQKDRLFQSIKTTLRDMLAGGGRDVENDLLGNPGSYVTRMSRNTAGKPCTQCGSIIQKEAYLGGSVYICSTCQVL
jgi:formamidopyrimidine-DNA glycosylase